MMKKLFGTVFVYLLFVLAALGGRDAVHIFVFPDKPFDLRALIDPRLEASYIPTAIKSMQSFVIVIGNTSTSNTATITAVSTGNATIQYSGEESIDGTNEVAYVVLSNATTVTATRIGSSNQTTVGGWVIEYRPGVLKSIQRGTISIAALATSNTATITSVNTAKTNVAWLGNAITDGGSNNRPGIAWYSRVALTNATTVTASNTGDTTYAKVVSYEVREFN